MKRHSNPSIVLSSKKVISKAKLLRIVFDLSYLIVIAFKISTSKMRFVKTNIERHCINSIIDKIKFACSLTNFYLYIIKTSSKLIFIEKKFQLLKNKTTSTLIMLLFSKITFVIKQVSQDFISIAIHMLECSRLYTYQVLELLLNKINEY